MNAENGSAIFGKQGSGQIVIDPKNTNGKIYSTDFWKPTGYGEDGLPTSYSSGNENGAGLLIDLVEPEIRFGNGNFKVTKDGYLTAKGGGSIAGWSIGDTKLSSNNGNVYLDSSATGSSIMFKAGNYFSVKANGALKATDAYIDGEIYAEDGEIGGWIINTSTITGGNTTLNSNGSIKVGNNFNVDTSGILTASGGTFSGTVTSTDGKIGGWTINSSSISKGVTILSSNEAYGLLTIPFIKIPDSNYYFTLIDGAGSSVLGYFKGATDVSTTQVVGIASDNRSVVLQSNSNHIRLSAGGDDRNKNIYLTGKKLYWNGDELDPIAVFG